ncbi:MBL fold metallo-hydrolase [Massilia sp. W12]|uniref:MBL fold metallo-hydrolase n=1 Tax=Massilia sp. W12 TaxID=3126507 RepID=UPI0030D0A5D0
MKNPYYDASRPHHRPDGFQNNYQPFAKKKLGELLRWRWQAWRKGPPQMQQALPHVAPELAFIEANAGAGLQMTPAATWIGHITVLLQCAGWNILTDPVFAQRCSPFQWLGPARRQPPALQIDQLPPLDLILLSHNHYDHMDEASLRRLMTRHSAPPLIVCPLGHRAWFAKRGIFHVHELDWWDSLCLPQQQARQALEIVLTPAQHWSSRTPFDAMQALWGGFALFCQDAHLFFAGDTGYSPDFADIRQRFAARQSARPDGGFDLALLPIGAYEPRWFMQSQHVNPAESVRIFQDLACRQALAVHWGTFQLTDEPLDQPPRDLAQALAAAGIAQERFAAVANGATLRWPRRWQYGASEAH